MDETASSFNVHAIVWLQIFLMSLPLLFICIYIIVNMYVWLRNHRVIDTERSTEFMASQENSSSAALNTGSLSLFPARLLEDEGLLEDRILIPSYHTF